MNANSNQPTQLGETREDIVRESQEALRLYRDAPGIYQPPMRDCPCCGRTMSIRETTEQGICNDCQI